MKILLSGQRKRDRGLRLAARTPVLRYGTSKLFNSIPTADSGSLLNSIPRRHNRKSRPCYECLETTVSVGERNAGYGLFEFTTDTIDLPGSDTGDQFVTLSPICPKSPEQLSVLLDGNITYAINPLTGWVSTTGTATRRKQINMFAEGSVLNAGEEQPVWQISRFKTG